MQLIHCVAPTKPLTRREHELRKRIEGTILLTAANDGNDIDEEEFKRWVFTEEVSKRVRMNLAVVVTSLCGLLTSGN